ncbi:PepSY domain-containing protein [Pseudenhygromyxa sp. WMMC2535]|uniref:PepSY-associated TM helix domain-containing protein n=1 Tax=Pseudenhygromyxa sp. WMMC2535 TaxID=2712867 RepID=UPI0015550F12|nr:PepSY-associated TM helix domain-containing protein [Pseudenhygromyxa sp. WMMC2535]NVB37615.1 PepSY domain-containing protein [Pseudenhygromyxa sp. WMMC2535]
MPATLRKVFLWIHLVLGVATAVVALSLCVSGALLAAELPVTRWAERRLVEPPATATPGSLPELETLVPKIVAQSERAPEQITVGHDPRDPLVVSFGRREQSLYDPWTGEALGEGPAGIEGFFRKVMTFHRWFSLEGSGREAARAIVGVSTLIFVLMIPTGLLLWLPRRWRWPAVRSVLLFRRGLSGKARDFNWHNVLGFWSALVLLVLALTGAGIAYDWVGNGLTRLAGGEVSEGGRGGPGRGGPGGGGPATGGPATARPARERAGARARRPRRRRPSTSAWLASTRPSSASPASPRAGSGSP